MRMTAMSMPANSGVLVSSVPALRGTGDCLASDPARPSANISGANLPSSITTPPIVLYQAVLVVNPANADPLLLAIEANAYMISVSPCGPGFSIELVPNLVASDSPAAVRITTGSVRKYSAAYFISAGRIFFPMYSGVRPTISPATNTVTMASTRMPYMPAPIPPGAISPSAMSNSAIPPPNGVSESWKQFTAPVEVTVVDDANSEQPGGPNLVSTPSYAPCASWGAAPAVPRWVSKSEIPPTAAAQMMTITATSAYPCLLSPTILPNARGVENGISSSRKISKMFVNGLGFSNGWAELTLNQPPPLLPRSLMTSCDATVPPGMVWCPPASVAIV